MKNKKPIDADKQIDLWEKVHEIAENQYSLVDGRLDRQDFIERCLAEFEIYSKNIRKKGILNNDKLID